VGVRDFEDDAIASVPFAVDDAVDLAHLFTLELQRMFPMSESIGILITICIQAAFRFSGSFFLVATLIPLLGKTDGNATFAAANSC
jgi:hypothetical protein